MDINLNQFTAYVPSVIAALAILIIGWLVAIVASRLVRAALRRTNLDNRLARSAAPGAAQRPLAVENGIASAVYYLILLVVLVAFLQAIGLTQVVTPLNAVLALVLSYIPRIISAGVLLLIAWVVARILRAVVQRAGSAAGLDERIGGQLSDSARTRSQIYETSAGTAQPSSGASAGGGMSITNTLAEVVYWLVFFLFLPAILDALNLQGLLAPVQGLLNEILSFLPNLFAAALILGIGWFVATIVRRIVTNLLAAIGTDRLAERVGIRRALGAQQLSGLLGLVVYVLILLPVLVAALNALQLDAVTAPISNMLNQFLAAIPNIFAAVVLLAITFVVAHVIARLVASLLAGAGFNALVLRMGLVRLSAVGGTAPSELVGNLVLVALMLFASIEALNLLGFEELGVLVRQFMVFAGHILVGLLIFAIGLWLATLAARTIRTSGTQYPRLLALAAQVAILVLSGAMALRQMGIANEIINLAFGLLLGALAIAVALAFGLGGREVAAAQLAEWRRRLRTEGDAVAPEPLTSPLPPTTPPTTPLTPPAGL